MSGLSSALVDAARAELVKLAALESAPWTGPWTDVLRIPSATCAMRA